MFKYFVFTLLSVGVNAVSRLVDHYIALFNQLPAILDSIVFAREHKNLNEFIRNFDDDDRSMRKKHTHRVYLASLIVNSLDYLMLPGRLDIMNECDSTYELISH